MHYFKFSTLPLIAMLSACATYEPGWSGQGAEPFEEALADCQRTAAETSDPDARDAVLVRCMAEKGWTRD